MIARRGQNQYVGTVRYAHYAGLRADEPLFHQQRTAMPAAHRVEFVHRPRGLLRACRDHHTLARRQRVQLNHDPARLPHDRARSIARPVRVGKCLAMRRGYSSSRHYPLCVVLGGFDPGGSSARPEHRDALAAHGIG